MHDDDRPVGQVLTRREVLASLGAAGVAMVLPDVRGPLILAGGAVIPACVVRPAQTEGPYFVDEKLNRADIRSDPGSGKVSTGSPLDLAFRVSRLNGAACAPLAGAVVDIWQCDADGVYSDVKDIGGQFNTIGQKFLRGHQVTGPDGMARFVTVYPGWYTGRTVHIHFKIRTDPGSQKGTEFTSQVYFDDAFTDTVFAAGPYRKGDRTRNERDGIFRNGGSQLMLDVVRKGERYASMFDIGLQIA